MVLFLDISISNCSQVVYIKTVELYILPLYVETLLNTLTSCSNLLIDPLGFSMQTIISSTKKKMISFSPSGLDTFPFSGTVLDLLVQP